ncbi:hypothetical protein KA005_09805, partial [bacterium]|nr:hypothetical protein [bacterium]
MFLLVEATCNRKATRMFRPNKKHLQTAIFTSVDQLSPKRQRRLKESWAGTFYREFFCRLD